MYIDEYDDFGLRDSSFDATCRLGTSGQQTDFWDRQSQEPILPTTVASGSVGVMTAGKVSEQGYLDTGNDGWGLGDANAYISSTSDSGDADSQIQAAECVDTSVDSFGWDDEETCMPTSSAELLSYDSAQDRPFCGQDPLYALPETVSSSADESYYNSATYEEHARAREDLQHASERMSETADSWSGERWFNSNASTNFITAQRDVEIAKSDFMNATTSDEFASARLRLAEAASRLATAESRLAEADVRVEDTYETHQLAVQEKAEALARLHTLAS